MVVRKFHAEALCLRSFVRMHLHSSALICGLLRSFCVFLRLATFRTAALRELQKQHLIPNPEPGISVCITKRQLIRLFRGKKNILESVHGIPSLGPCLQMKATKSGGHKHLGLKGQQQRYCSGDWAPRGRFPPPRHPPDIHKDIWRHTQNFLFGLLSRGGSKAYWTKTVRNGQTTILDNMPLFSGVDKRVVSKRVVLADVPQERKPERVYIRMFLRNENRNEGTFACSPGMKTGPRARSPKPPFDETAL